MFIQFLLFVQLIVLCYNPLGAEGVSDRFTSIKSRIDSAMRPDSFHRVFVYAGQLRGLAMEKGDALWLARGYNYEGFAHYRLSEYQEAIKAYNKALNARNEWNNEQLLLELLYNVALTHKKLSNLESASEKLIEFLETEAIQKYPDQKMSAYEMLGNIQRALGEFDRAFSYHFKCLSMRSGKADTVGMAKSLNNIGSVHYELGNYDSAKYYLLRSIELKEEHGETERLAFSLSTLGRVYADQGKLERAMLCYRRALAKINPKSETQQYAYTLGHLAMASLEAGKADSAMWLNEKALEYAGRLQGNDLLASTYQAHSKILFRLGRYQEAYAFQEKYQEYRKKILDEDKQRAISELEIKYQTEESNKKYHEEKRLRQLAATKLSNNRLVTVVLALTLLLFGVVIWFLRLNALNEKKLVKQKERLLKELHHRVKNNLSILSGALAVQEQKEESEAVKRIIRDHRHRTNAINILHNSLFAQGSDEAKTEVKFDTFIRELANNLILTSSMKEHIHAEYQLDALILDIDRAVPLGMIINELLTNAIKHAFMGIDEHKLFIAMEVGNEIVITVKDNGDGLADPTAADQLSSAGMTIVHGLARQIGTAIEFHNDHGLVVLIRLKR